MTATARNADGAAAANTDAATAPNVDPAEIAKFALLAQSAGWTPIRAWTDGFFSVHALAKA